MHVANVLPNEFICGYRGRLGRLNQYANETDFMVALRAYLHPQCKSGYPSAATLALAAGMEMQRFVHNHTMLSLHRAVTPHDPQTVHGDPSRLEHIDCFGARLFQQHARLCPDCIREDVRRHRFAYWHLSHQLPGITWCLEHGTELLRAEGGRHAFKKMPSDVSTLPRSYSDQEMAEIVSAPVIRRYAEILQVFLRAEHPVALLHANYRIRQLAKQRQFRIATEGKKPTLTDIIETVLPGAWLRTEYPEMSSRKAGEYCASIDIITVKRTPVPVYALALAALFESADEALKYWFDQTAESPSERKTYRRFGWNFWHSERVFELYVAHRGNHAKIGEILEIDPNNTRLGLSSAGLPALGLVDMNAAGKALRDFDQGTPLDRACERNGAARNEVEKLLRVGCSRLLTALERIEQPEMPRQRSRTLHKTAPAEEVGRASPRSRRRNQNPYRSGVVSLFS